MLKFLSSLRNFRFAERFDRLSYALEEESEFEREGLDDAIEYFSSARREFDFIKSESSKYDRKGLRCYIELTEIIPELGSDDRFEHTKDYVKWLEAVRDGCEISLEQRKEISDVLRKISKYHSDKFLGEVQPVPAF